jgi:membrane protein DedA with SNARE-associated domain
MNQVNDFVLASAGFPWVYVLVFAWVLIDAFFPPAPSDIIVVGLTALSISAGVPNTWALALAAALGAIAGDNVSYEIGRRIGVDRWRWMRGPRAERAIGSARTSLQRRPMVLMLTARYVPIGRVAVTMVSGATGFPRRRYVALSVLAGISWSAYMVGVGVLAGTWSKDNPLLSVGLAVVTATALGVLIDRSAARFEKRRDLRRNAAILAESLPEKAMSTR